MKTKIKRHSRSVLSVVLAVCMLVSCMTVSLIMTDAAQTSQQSATGAAADEAVAAAIDSQPAQEEGAALDTDEADDVSAANSSAVGAKADSESVSAANAYCVKGSFNGWSETNKFDATTKKVSINLDANKSYYFKIYSTYGKKWYGATKDYIASDNEYNFNTSIDQNAKITTTIAGAYVFELKSEDDNGVVRIGVTYPTPKPKTYTITKANTDNGSFTVSKTTATAGTRIDITAKPNRGYEVNTVSVSGGTAVSGTGNNRYYFTMPSQNVTVSVTFKTATAYTITANQVTEGGTINITLTSGGTTVASATATISAGATLTAYSGETLKVTASPASGYQLDTLTVDGSSCPSGYSVTVSKDITDIAATFTQHTYSNQFTANLGTGTGNTYNKVKASFYDYYTDGEFNNGTPNWIKGIKNAERGENQATCTPNDTLNTAIRDYTYNNSLPYPLYFGNFLGWSDYALSSYNRNEEEGWNFYNKVNNSQGLGGDHKSVTGLTGQTLSNGMPTHYKSDGTNENGAEMKLFDRSWLSDGTQNGQGELATIIDSPFPVRTKTVTYGSGSHEYYEFDSESDNLWFEGIESRYDNSNVYLEQSACSGDNWYAHFFNDGNTKVKDVPMTKSGNYFTATNPDPSTYTKVIFCRMNDTNAPDSRWSNVNKQTSTLTYPDGSNNQLLYTLSGYGTGNLMNGSWGPYSGATQNPITPTVNYSTNNSDAVYSPNYGNRGFYPFDHNHAGTSSTNNRAWDLGFGVSMEIKFTLGPDGKTADGAEQVFEYSGDDDLWVFVDDQLILDLGGDHKKSTGKINFATKTITDVDSIAAPGSSATRNSSFTLSNQTVHTMKIFYMERGMFDSNLKFGFSMYPFDDSYEVEKVADVDTNKLNAGLKSQYSDTFTFINTSQDGKGDNAAYKVFNAAGVNTGTGTSNEQREFTISNGEIAQFSNVFTENQTLQTEETTSGVYQYDTSYRVVDMQNNEALVKAGDGKNTGTFNFLTTLAGADPALDITHLRAIFTNTLKTESFMVTKEIDGFDDVDTAFPFIVTIKMSKNNYEFNVSNLQYKTSLDDYATVRTLSPCGINKAGLGYIHEGEHILFEGIPQGAKVTVHEPTYGDKFTPEADGNANCYKNVTINSENSSNAPQYTDRDGNHSDVTIQLKGFDTITITNELKNYRMDYQLPTRLYGEKIYKLTGYITPAMVAQGYVQINNTEHTAYLTRKFVSDHIPRESIFMKDVIWSSADTDFSKSMTGFDNYVYLQATSSDQKLTVQVDRDGDGSYDTTVRGLNCGQPIKDANGEYITGANGNPIYWEIKSTDTDQFVTKCYSAELNYVAYDNYSIKAVYGQGTGYDYYDKQVTATVNDLGITRSHWNDTITGINDPNTYIEPYSQQELTYNYNLADTDYDRLYLDIELAFESHGKMINTYDDSVVKVGYEICILNDNGTLNKVYKDVVLNNTSLNNKNRIHAYYGFKNTEVNRGQNLGIRAYIITEGSTKYSDIMPFELNTEGSKGLSSEYDTTRP